MTTESTELRIDEEMIKQETESFEELPNYKAEVVEAMEEAQKISKDPAAKKYNSLSEALADLDADLMDSSELREKLDKGYADFEAGRVQNASEAFANFRANHGF